MNCYKHTETVAVASCAQGCGRGLCAECAEIYEPPTCENCAAQIESAQIQELSELKSSLIKRIAINSLFFVPYLVLMFTDDPPLWVGIFMLIWGFIGFRWLLDVFQAVTNLTLYNTFEGWGCNYLIGSGICAMFGFIVIPILVVMQAIQLKRISTLI